MFEREIKFIYDFNLNKVNKLGPYFTFEQLQSVDLHPAILQYISAEIDYLVFEDRQKLLKNSVFDYSGEKIVYYFHQITEELKKNKRFSLEYIAKIILHSTSFTVNYLVRPNWTLSRFIFDESKHKSSNEIKQILNYIYYYKYLKKIIIAYVNSKKILSMNVEEFEALLGKTDKLGLETNLKGILSNTLISMAEFLNIGQMQKTRVPLAAVELYLEEKDLPHHLSRLNETLGNDENARFNVSDFMKVLTKVAVEEREEVPMQVELIFDVDKEKSEEPEFELEELGDGAGEEKAALDPFDVNKDLIPEDERTEGTDSVAVEDSIRETVPFKETEKSVIDDSSVDEITEILSSNDEIKITPHTKIKIRVKEDNKIEPVTDEVSENFKGEGENSDQQVENSEAEGFDSYSSLISELKKESTSEEYIAHEGEQLFSKLEEEVEEIKEEENVENLTELQESKSYGSLATNLDMEEEKVFEKEESEIETDFREKKDYNQLENKPVIKYEGFKEEKETRSSSKLDISEILEHKNMTRIIEVVFDYDIEDFANVLDEISNCHNIDDAFYIIHEVLASRKINRNSKEADTLREFITEYFNRK
jgi:hypothetical protein